MPVGLSDSFFVPCIPTKTVNLGNGNFSAGGGEFCHFKTGIPGAPDGSCMTYATMRVMWTSHVDFDSFIF